jgi:hypothetical protein
MWLIQERPDGTGTVPVFVRGRPLRPGRVPSDCCGAGAWVRVIVADGLPLDFCAHHYTQHRTALAARCYPVDDQRRELLGAVPSPAHEQA